MEKKKLDPKWVAELMSFIIGPQMTILMMKNPRAAKDLTTILQGAVADLYENEDFPDTNAWVVAASDRLIELFNTYMTAKLMKMFDDGVPEAKRIVSAGTNIIQ